MSNELTISLDDYIKQKMQNDKNGKFRRLVRQHRGGRSGFRNKFSSDRPKDFRKRLTVENLNKTLLNTDLTNLFSKYGKLIRCGIKYDKMGQSTGLADVEFSTHEECEAAINALDHALADGVEMRVKYTNRIGGTYRRTKQVGSSRRTLRKVKGALRRNRLRGADRRARRLRGGRLLRRRAGQRVSLRTRRIARKIVASGAGNGIKRRVFAKSLGRRRLATRK